MAEVALQLALLREIRQELRGGRGAGVTAKPDPLIHPITRLSICGLLAAGADWVEFAALRDAAGISDSVLSKQSRVLEDAGYVEVRKGAVGRRPAHLVPAHRRGPRGGEGSPGLAGRAGGGGLRQRPGCAAGKLTPRGSRAAAPRPAASARQHLTRSSRAPAAGWGQCRGFALCAGVGWQQQV